MYSLLSRIRRLWDLSDKIEEKEIETIVIPTVKETRKKIAQFIPRIIKDPIKELTEEQP